MNTVHKKKIQEFQEHIWSFYHAHKRHFAWRTTDDPYRIVVSEVMLQQTQTFRVAPKYEQFIMEFPTFTVLAASSLRDVLSVWQGLGYNRRAKFLHQLAHAVVTQHQGALPRAPDQLMQLPGIGKATAASVCAFAFNQPTVFIETNIRAVFIHTFFRDMEAVSDSQIYPLVAATLDQNNPREWYYALMDYGVYIKKLHKNPSTRSAHHTKQSRFEGSDRQIRGAIVRLLTEHQTLMLSEIVAITGKEPARVEKIAAQLCSEQFIVRAGDIITLAQ